MEKLFLSMTKKVSEVINFKIPINNNSIKSMLLNPIKSFKNYSLLVISYLLLFLLISFLDLDKLSMENYKISKLFLVSLMIKIEKDGP